VCASPLPISLCEHIVHPLRCASRQPISLMRPDPSSHLRFAIFCEILRENSLRGFCFGSDDLLPSRDSSQPLTVDPPKPDPPCDNVYMPAVLPDNPPKVLFPVFFFCPRSPPVLLISEFSHPSVIPFPPLIFFGHPYFYSLPFLFFFFQLCEMFSESPLPPPLSFSLWRPPFFLALFCRFSTERLSVQRPDYHHVLYSLSCDIPGSLSFSLHGLSSSFTRPTCLFTFIFV